MDAYSMEWLLAKTKRLELQKDMYKEQRDYLNEKVKELDSLLHVYLSLIAESDKNKVMEELLSLLDEVSMQTHVPEYRVQVFYGGAPSSTECTSVNRKEKI